YAEVHETPYKDPHHKIDRECTDVYEEGQLLPVLQGASSTQRGDQDCTTRSPRRAGHGHVQPHKRNEERTIDGQRTGTARPLPLWRLPSGPDSPPINPIFGSGISPQARTAGHLTFQPLVRFRARCNLPFARSTLPSSVARLLHTAG